MDIMTIEERAARQSEIRARLAEIDTEYAGAALPDDARSEWDALNTEHDEHERSIADARRRQDRIRSLAGQEGHTESGGDPGRSDRPARGARRLDNIYDLMAIRQQASGPDDLPGLYRDYAMRAIESSHFSGVQNREVAQGHVSQLLARADDDQGTLARRILVTGSPVYQRAFGKFTVALNTHGLTAEEQRALSVGTTTEGGFAVPYDLDPTIILTSAGSANPLRRIARVEQIVGKEWQGITSAGITVARAAESAQASDNAPALAQPVVKAERVQGFVPFSIEIEQDWSTMQSEMTRLLADAKDEEEAVSFITGTGISPAAGGVVKTLAAGSNVTANTITAAAVFDLEAALGDRFLDNASFLAHRSIYTAVRQLDTTGGSLLWARLGEGLPPELIGYPAYRSSAMVDATIAINDRWLLLGDFRHFLIVDRLGMTVDVVPHLFGANQRPTGQRGLYAIWRNNSVILAAEAFRIANKAA